MTMKSVISLLSLIPSPGHFSGGQRYSFPRRRRNEEAGKVVIDEFNPENLTTSVKNANQEVKFQSRVELR